MWLWRLNLVTHFNIVIPFVIFIMNCNSCNELWKFKHNESLSGVEMDLLFRGGAAWNFDKSRLCINGHQPYDGFLMTCMVGREIEYGIHKSMRSPSPPYHTSLVALCRQNTRALRRNRWEKRFDLEGIMDND